MLLALSFPKFGHPAIGWVALAPLLLSLNRQRLGRAFLLGLSTGIVYFTGTLYWITHVMVTYGDLPLAVAILVNAALIAYLALFPALFALVTCRILLGFGIRGLIAAPLVWVATELGRTYLLTGFPWVLLGYSQVSELPVAQLASVVGVYGVSALVASVSAACVVVPLAQTKAERWATAVTIAVLVVGVAAWGSWRVGRASLTREGSPIRVGLLQGNVDQGIKWDPQRASAIFRDYLSMTREAMARGAELVIWPESSIPFFFEEDAAGAEQLRTLARQARVPILFGSDQIERDAAVRLYNSAFLVRADGSTAAVYRKMHLVPFGEYVPLKNLLFFAGPLVQAVSDFSPGTSPVLMPVGEHRVSTAICYEIVYPELVRQFVARGSELLTTITNDAWFGRTSAPHQHFAQAAMRAIENGRYLVRSANTGISGVVDPYGRVAARSGLFEPAVLVEDVRFVQAPTVYTRIGDAFAYVSVAVTAALLVMAARGKRR